MKRNRLLAALMCGTLMLGGLSLPVMADGMKVVTLGADLNEAQKQTMMNYFKANPNEVQILTITNQDERNHLGAYVPLEQIGTRTLSCAYVKPTTSGGIRVRTANLNYVTGNMIASTLTTSGVTNCEVIAACPFEVSGTGALTGIQMAYDRASGVALDPVKKDLAAQELVVTGNVASTAGNNDATMLVNAAKMEVIQNNVTNVEDITNIVYNIVNQNNITVNETTIIQVVDLLAEIAEQDYDYEEIAPTLENVNENVSEVVEVKENPDAEADIVTSEEPEYDETSILNEIDESALGENIPTSSTDDPSLEVVTYDPAVELGENVSESEDKSEDPGSEFGIPEASETVFYSDGTEAPSPETEPQGTEEASAVDQGAAENAEDPFYGETAPDQTTSDDGWETYGEDTTDQLPQEEQTYGEPVDGQTADETYGEAVDGQTSDDGWENYGDDTAEQLPQEEVPAEEGTEETGVPAEEPSAGTAEQELILRLSEQAKSEYDEAAAFCAAEFEGDITAVSSVLEPGYMPSCTLDDKELSQKLSDAVRGRYLEILANGTASFIPNGTEKYMSTELNMMADWLNKLFGAADASPEASLAKDLTPEQKSLLLGDCIRFFEKLYGESASAPETAPAQNPEEAVQNQEAAQYEGQGEQDGYYGEEGYEQDYYGEESYEQDGYYGEESYAGDYYGQEEYGIPEGTEEYY